LPHCPTKSANDARRFPSSWELSLTSLDRISRVFPNRIYGNTSELFHAFLDEHGPRFDSATKTRRLASEPHKRIGTLRFVETIEQDVLQP
jgi:hypothetical protein